MTALSRWRRPIALVLGVGLLAYGLWSGSLSEGRWIPVAVSIAMVVSATALAKRWGRRHGSGD